MLETLRARGIRDQRILDAFATIPRHLFVPLELEDQAYEDHPLAIGFDQTISQPYIVAVMLEALALTGEERVLEIGTGSGYQTALLAQLAKEVYSVEIVPELLERARKVLRALGADNVLLAVGDGRQGNPDAAPYLGIAVAAASSSIPAALVDQLQDQGRLVIPVGTPGGQELVMLEKKQHRVTVYSLGSCVFVPLVGGHDATEIAQTR